MASEVEAVPPTVKDEKETLSVVEESGGDKREAQEEGSNDPVKKVDNEEEPPGGEKKVEEGGEGEGEAEKAKTTTPSPRPSPSPSPQQHQMSNNQAAEGVPKELLVKHPLQYRWVLWYCKQDRNKAWEECLKQVATFDTVEDFWALYNHIQLASGLSFGSDYYLFKEDIRPMWEDPHNIEGGRWLIQVDKNRRAELLDHYWLELLMAVIGEQFDDNGEQICGLVVNIRQKGDKISLWTRDATKDETNKRIGSIAKQKLDMGESINYEQHKDTSHKNSSMVKPKLRV